MAGQPELTANLAVRVPLRVDVHVPATLLEHLGLVVGERPGALRAAPARTAQRHDDGSGDTGPTEVDVGSGAGPLRPLKLSVQRTVALLPLSFTVAENAPAAPADALGFGTSARTASVARYEYVEVLPVVVAAVAVDVAFDLIGWP